MVQETPTCNLCGDKLSMSYEHTCWALVKCQQPDLPIECPKCGQDNYGKCNNCDDSLRGSADPAY